LNIPLPEELKVEKNHFKHVYKQLEKLIQSHWTTLNEFQKQKKIRFFVAVEKFPDHVYVDFVLGSPFQLRSDFQEFRKFYRQLHNENFLFSTVIKRRHKLSSFVEGIKKRDPHAQFSVDNGEIHVSWIS
jgi:hypothetical protein